MRRVFFVVICCVAVACYAAARDWTRDILGDGFEMSYVEQTDDYSGKVRSTIIRYKPCADSRHGVLYVHGYNDYFFQSQMAEQFFNRDVNFYAVDLRKYGRSLLPGQKKFEARDMHEYFSDIDSALVEMNRNGINQIVLMGHSTGGLITSLYVNETKPEYVIGLILNSPFLEWNFNGFMRKVAIPMFGSLGKLFPTLSISQGNGTGYGESLLKNHHGEWDYNTDWKLFHSQKVEASWVRAVSKAQNELKKHASIDIPILLLRSSGSVTGDKWTPEYQHNDAVLNVEDISKIGLKLGNNVTECVINGGLHDLSLSNKEARTQFYEDIFHWLDVEFGWKPNKERA